MSSPLRIANSMQPTTFTDQKHCLDEEGWPVLVLASSPSEPEQHWRWLDALRRIETLSREWPACREFRLVRNQGEPQTFVACIEFDSGIQFARFVREAGLLWIDQIVGQPTHYEIFEILPEPQAFQRASHQLSVPTRLATKSPSQSGANALHRRVAP